MILTWSADAAGDGNIEQVFEKLIDITFTFTMNDGRIVVGAIETVSNGLIGITYGNGRGTKDLPIEDIKQAVWM